MRLADTRPPFAGLANLSEAALAALPTPCYLLDEARLRRNGEILLGVQQRTGCKILLAQKAFSNYDLYPVLAPYLAGTEASGLYESRLGREELPEGFEAAAFDYVKLGGWVEALGPLTAPTTNQRLYRVGPDGTMEDITKLFRRKP